MMVFVSLRALDVDDAKRQNAHRHFDIDRLALFAAHEALAHGRLIGDLVVGGIFLGVAADGQFVFVDDFAVFQLPMPMRPSTCSSSEMTRA